MMKWTIVIAAILMFAGLAAIVGILAHSHQTPPAAAAETVSLPLENSLAIQPTVFPGRNNGSAKTARVVIRGRI